MISVEVLPHSVTENEIPATYGTPGNTDRFTQMIEHTTYHPYTQAKLVDLANQFSCVALMPVEFRGGQHHVD